MNVDFSHYTFNTKKETTQQHYELDPHLSTFGKIPQHHRVAALSISIYYKKHKYCKKQRKKVRIQTG